MVCHPERLSRYLDGELPLPERRLLDCHLANCPPCAAEIELLRRNDRILWSFGRRRVAVPREVEERLASSVRRRRSLGPLLAFSRMMPAAFGTTVAALLLLVSTNLSSSFGNRQSGGSTALPSTVQTRFVKQSAKLMLNRRTQAILAGRTTQINEPAVHRLHFDEN